MKTKIKYVTSTRSTRKTVEKTEPKDLITVILLYDIETYRMKSYGPLPLINIGQKKLLDIQIEHIKKHFCNFELILCVGNDSDKIYKHIKNTYSDSNIRLVENQVHSNSNSCESIRLCLNNTMNSKILICNGDLILNDSLSIIEKDKTCVLTEEDPCENLEIGINTNELNLAEHFSFGANKTWSEILFIHNQENVEIIKKIISQNTYKNKFIFELLNEFIKLKNNIKCISNKKRINKISNIKTYHKIKGGI